MRVSAVQQHLVATMATTRCTAPYRKRACPSAFTQRMHVRKLPQDSISLGLLPRLDKPVIQLRWRGWRWWRGEHLALRGPRRRPTMRPPVVSTILRVPDASLGIIEHTSQVRWEASIDGRAMVGPWHGEYVCQRLSVPQPPHGYPTPTR